jgi:hypothetical protein
MERLATAEQWANIRSQNLYNQYGFPGFITALQLFREWLDKPMRSRPDALGSIPVVWKATGQIGNWYPPSKQCGFQVYGRNLCPGIVQVGRFSKLAEAASALLYFTPVSVGEVEAAVEIIQPNSEGAAIMLSGSTPAYSLRPGSNVDVWFNRYWGYAPRVNAPWW